MERQQLEEKRRREEEKRKREEELKQQQAEEDRLRKEEERVAEQHRRQQEALQRLQEQQALAQAQARVAQQGMMQQQQPVAKAPTVTAAPWAQHVQQQPDNNDALSMTEIQKIQEEREMKERALAQAQKAEQTARAAALLQQQQQQAAIKLRWAKQSVSTAAKSLAEIQAEEAAQLARQKEKERLEKASQQVNLNLAAAGAWGASHNNSAWSSGRTAAAVVGQPPAAAPAPASSSASNPNAGWKTGSVGFWEEPATIKAQPTATKAQPSPKVQNSAKAQNASVNKPAATKTAVSSAAATTKKNRSNKDEETVRKLFVQTTEKKDNFSQWCFEYLKKVQAPIDVPTFVSFLKVYVINIDCNSLLSI